MTTAQILALANPLLCAVFGTAFALLWHRDRSVAWTALVAVSYFAGTIGFTIFHFTGNPNGAFSISAMHLFYSISAITLVWGICKRAGQPLAMKSLAAIAVLTVGLLIGASYGEDYNARLYAANACYGLILALGCQAASREQDKDGIDKAIVGLLALGAAQFFTRPLVAIMVEGAMTAEYYRETPFYAIMVIFLALSGMLMAMTLLIAALSDQMKLQHDDACRDPLTGLRTRGPFEEEAVSLIERSRREGVPVSIVVADLDHFKTVNDTFGHQVGDHAIIAFGCAIDAQIRASDVAGRIGGEEFCIVLWNCNARAAEAMAERVRRSLLKVHVNGFPETMRMTASFGVAQHRNNEGYGKLFARADSALYRAKHDGRDRVRMDGQLGNVTALKPGKALRRGVG